MRPRGWKRSVVIKNRLDERAVRLRAPRRRVRGFHSHDAGVPRRSVGEAASSFTSVGSNSQARQAGNPSPCEDEAPSRPAPKSTSGSPRPSARARGASCLVFDASRMRRRRPPAWRGGGAHPVRSSRIDKKLREGAFAAQAAPPSTENRPRFNWRSARTELKAAVAELPRGRGPARRSRSTSTSSSRESSAARRMRLENAALSDTLTRHTQTRVPRTRGRELSLPRRPSALDPPLRRPREAASRDLTEPRPRARTPGEGLPSAPPLDEPFPALTCASMVRELALCPTAERERLPMSPIVLPRITDVAGVVSRPPERESMPGSRGLVLARPTASANNAADD